MKKLIPDQVIIDIGEELAGGCHGSLKCSIEELGYDYNDITMKQLGLFDETVFVCPECEWWCWDGEQTFDDSFPEGFMCGDCAQYYEGE